MGCGASQSATSSVRVYVPVKAKSSATPTSKGQPRLGGPRGSSDSLKSFSDSALNVKLSTDKNLVLLWDGELPGASAYYEQAVMVLKIKGIEYTEEIISSSNPPSWFQVRATSFPVPCCAQVEPRAKIVFDTFYLQGIHDASLPFLVWKDRSTKDVTPAGRADIKGLFKFVEVCSRAYFLRFTVFNSYNE